MENLWQLKKEEINSPIKILGYQASCLEELTEGYVRAEIIERQSNNEELSYNFIIGSRYMPSYSFQLFYIVFPVVMYPIKFVVPQEIAQELNIMVTNTLFGVVCENEEEFKVQLKRVLNTNYANKVINGIRSIVRTKVEDE